ncbi:uncharacterized protein LOC141865880 isoform X1 [Acropora palmata]|uniref:uncharacterized protein LOC141865880 isoform X1 n=1 Tax=Acropora palmata TaxID=6131 RepID=UPI003DA061A9
MTGSVTFPCVHGEENYELQLDLCNRAAVIRRTGTRDDKEKSTSKTFLIAAPTSPLHLWDIREHRDNLRRNESKSEPSASSFCRASSSTLP